jgi:two-component system sensor histidine kinase MtrB
MTDARVPTTRLRRRLTIAFTLVAGVAALALAAGSYWIVRETRLDDSVDRALDQSRFNLELAQTVLGGSSGRAATDELLAALSTRGDFETVGIVDDTSFSSSVSLGPEQVPDGLRPLVADGELAYQRAEVAGTPTLVTGGQVAGSDVELYFFFSEQELTDDLAQLRNVLLAGVVVLALLGALVGAILARRTLAPVARASAAAQSLAEGLLETRIPVERADEFGAWAASFNQMADALQSKIAALSAAQERERRFTSDVAHELRTPLTALVAEAELLGEHLDRMPADARRPAELLVADVGRLRRLVDDLMEISRLDAGAVTARAEPVDLRALVDGVVRDRGWGERVRVEGSGGQVDSDPRRIERVVANLVGNALEHGGGKASVVVADRTVEVRDDGPGIPAEQLPHVFDRFWKGDPSRTGPGSGLGLAIARENARLLGGDVTVESEPGQGAAFTFRLP